MIKENFQKNLIICDKCQGKRTILGEKCLKCNGTGKRNNKKNKVRFKIILEHYQNEILVYCPEIPYFHRFYDRDTPFIKIKQDIQENIKNILSGAKPEKQDIIFISF